MNSSFDTLDVLGGYDLVDQKRKDSGIMEALASVIHAVWPSHRPQQDPCLRSGFAMLLLALKSKYDYLVRDLYTRREMYNAANQRYFCKNWRQE